MTATATKTSPEKISLFHMRYFAIISTRSTFTKMANYQATKLVGVAFKLRKKIKNSPSCVHVLHKTLYCMWSLHVVVLQRTAKCKTHVQSDCVCSLKPIVLRRCRCRCRRRCPEVQLLRSGSGMNPRYSVCAYV